MRIKISARRPLSRHAVDRPLNVLELYRYIAGTHVSCSARVAHRLPCAEAHERLPDERLLVCLCQLVLPQRERALQRVPEG